MILAGHRATKGILIALCVLLTGCGFALRGTQQVPVALQPLAVDCNNVPGELCQALKDQLELNDVAVTSASEADYLLRLGNFDRQRRTSAITTTAAAAEYTLRHSVQLQIVTSDRVPLIEPATLSATETYRYDETNVLAKRREEAALEQQLNDRLTQQIMFRLVPLTKERIRSMREQYDTEHPEAGQ
jgi:LPS-assembly lipoprotein